VATVHGQLRDDPTLKEGGGSTGDDDRWGNVAGTPGVPTGGTPRPKAPAPTVTVSVLGVRIEMRLIPGLVAFVVTLR